MVMIPPATYRIQFTPEFGFKSASGIVDYLSELGGVWIYASPIFAARRGTAHGYDVVDPDRLNPELGNEADFNELVARLGDKEMGWLQDAVPNHMAYSGENPMLADLFAWGEKSEFTRYFDISWDHPAKALSGRVAAPLLGDWLEQCLERGEIRPTLRNGTLGVVYFEHFFPLRLSHYSMLDPTSPGMEPGLPREFHHSWLRIIRRIVDNAQAPPSTGRDSRILEAKQGIARMMDQYPEVRRFVDSRLKGLDPQSGKPDAIAGLRSLLSKQVYALRHWRSASQEINYRRFFDINELICLRQERRQVFDRTHQGLIRLIEEGKVNGIRVDHIDGLNDPAQYLHRLRQTCGDIYVVVEKILAKDEALSLSWPVEGTSGYEFSDRVTRLFCRRAGQEALHAFYQAFSGRKASFARVCRMAKRQVLQESFAGDLNNLVHAIQMAADQAGHAAETDPEVLRAAAVELLTRFPVYRTYATRAEFTKEDARLIHGITEEAIQAVGSQQPDLIPALSMIRDCFLSDAWNLEGGSTARFQAVSRFQNLCAPLAAKGIEDTALYRFVRLLSLNDVGGHPDQMGISPSCFHAFLAERQKLWPHTMNTLSTHDSKRSEDVRARINVLSEIPDEWRLHCSAWKESNHREKPVHQGTPVPDGNVEYLLYQTLVGTFPFEPAALENYEERIQNYMVKAVREAKEHTSWQSPDAGYEQALCRFIHGLLFPGTEEEAFMADFIPFVEKISRWGACNSLAQTLIKMTAPGVPDFYQGTEVFDFSLVDPDNRRPVDFKYRARLLKAIQGGQRNPPQIPEGNPVQEGFDRMKLYLITRALQTRRQRPALFHWGTYEPLKAVPAGFTEHVMAYARVHEGQYCLTVVPRFLTEMVPHIRAPSGDIWKDAVLRLPDKYPGTWTSAISGEQYAADSFLPIGKLFRQFPVALLMGEFH